MDVFQRREVAVLLLRRLRLRRAVSPGDPHCFLEAHVIVEYVARVLPEFRAVEWWCHLQAVLLRPLLLFFLLHLRGLLFFAFVLPCCSWR